MKAIQRIAKKNHTKNNSYERLLKLTTEHQQTSIPYEK